LNLNKRILLLIIILSGINFYQYQGFESLMNYSRFFGLFIILLIIIFNKSTKLFTPSRKYLNFYMIGIFLSVIACYFFWNQSFLLSIISLKMYMFIFVYFALHRLKPTINDIYYVITIIAIGYSIVYLLNYSMYPNHLFGNKASERRGTFTFQVYGSIFCVFSTFRYFSLAFIKKKSSKKNLFLFSLFLLVILLRAGRTQIMSILLPIVIYYISNGKFNFKKVLNSFFLMLAGYLLFIGFEDIFVSIYSKTLSDFSDANDNIRLLSANYYLFDHSPSNWNIIFGNGIYNGESEYGNYVLNTLWDYNGFYAEDIGLIGFWSYFGFITLFAYFRIMLIFFKKYNNIYIRMFGFYLILMSITTYDSYEADSLILQPILLYICDLNFNLKKNK
jgi:hypothetical protein